MPQIAGLHYYDYPIKDTCVSPVILIHGAGSNALGWPHPFRRFLNRRVIVPELPGHGLSAGTGFTSLDGYARSLTRFMDKFPLYRAVLIGHSMGACVALYTAMRNPGAITALVLLAAGFPFNLPTGLIDPLDGFDGQRLALKYFETAAFSPETPAALRRAITNPLRKVPLTLLRNDLQACAGFGKGIAWHTLTCPSLVVAGSEDGLVSLSSAKSLASLLPNSRFVQIQRAGHLLMHEQAEESLAVVKEFLHWLDLEKAL